MQILSITLKNFKSHSDRCFIFQPGTNAICGENGAGKTSILEAIAWTLFDYTGDYTKEDLIRNGASSAQVRIAFVSPRDGRTYEVQRCTTKSYTIYDPQLNERLPYSRVREEVLPWIRQQFGVAPGTDLGQLFSSTIGVPQGTFTADFLLTKERRKPVFDKILKVEEYQQTWKKLADLEKYAKLQVEDLERELARLEEDLQELHTLQVRRQQQQQDVDQLQAELQQTQAQVAALQSQVEDLQTLAARSQQIELELAQVMPQIQTQTRTLERLQQDLKEAETAVAICTANREAFQAFQQAEATLRELEQHRCREQILQQKKQRQEKQLSDRQTELAKLTLQLDRLTEARHAIAQLEPLAQQQQELERTQQTISQQIQTCHSVRQSIHEQEKRLKQIQTRQADLTQEIADIQTLAIAVQAIPTLEQQQQRLQQQISRVAATAHFEAELRHILHTSQNSNQTFQEQVLEAAATLAELQQTMPLWNEALDEILTTLKNGANLQQELVTALATILDDVAEQTSLEKLDQHLQTIQTQLHTARRNQTRFANLERLLADYAHLEADAKDLQTHLAALQAQLAEESTLQAKYTQLAQMLAELENPIARIQLWREELKHETTLLTKLEVVNASVRDSETAIAQLNEQLTAFATLAQDMQTQQTIRDNHRQAYEIYTANREMANSRKQRLHLVESTTAELQALEQRQATLTQERDRLRQIFDPEHFRSVQTAYQAARDQQTMLNTRLPERLKALKELDERLTRLEALQAKQTEAEAQLEQKKKTDRFIKFARKAYKEAGPRITERYIQSISREADKLFRELLNRPNVSLQWTRDYEIVVQEAAHSRRFVNLSGGEQMCAALAVRLALLKVLADLDVAFFDEPTTNMDRLRREQLADAIANIKTFRQLFVISHDDTFEKITENIIVIHREA
ncbi:MAG: SMC family ATPase [Oscillatoriales cyanobacterium C42_A2020_001]|nr:SMC family ATPase [Leptolyngbyaceae cyanobacterium C42_A2020_001]